MALGICETCKRHARSVCPFCGGRVIEPARVVLPRLTRAALALLAACGGQQQNVALYGGPPVEPTADAGTIAPAPEPPPTVTAQPMYGAAPPPQK